MRAASARDASACTVTAGVLISSPAVTAPALTRSARSPCSVSRNSSLSSRSASETTPTTRPSPASTGRALTFHSSSSATISLKGAALPTATTVCVITSLTL